MNRVGLSRLRGIGASATEEDGPILSAHMWLKLSACIPSRNLNASNDATPRYVPCQHALTLKQLCYSTDLQPPNIPKNIDQGR